ncbi:MAG: cobalamin adenosyltransferase [Brevinemataceae bacterium]
MGVITENYLRKLSVSNSITSPFVIKHGDILTSAAKDFLNNRKIPIVYEKNNSRYHFHEKLIFSKPVNKEDWETQTEFINFYTKEKLNSKPESMTHLFENVLVFKNDPRIVLRGRLDTLQALIIEAQIFIDQNKKNASNLLNSLDELLQFTREILGCEVLNKDFPNRTVLGLSSDQIREHSHNPEKYFQLKQMVLVNYKQGPIVSKLNYLRTYSRECELIAVDAFRKDNYIEHQSIIQALNRLSSCFHILMYKELSKY